MEFGKTMHLKYLTLCLMGLSLSACSQYVTKTNSTSKNLAKRASDSINAIYNYPSFDYRGTMQIHAQPQQKAQHMTASLDTATQQKIEQYLKYEQVDLTKQQKQDLYQALAQAQATSLNRYSYRKKDRFAHVIRNILNDMQFEYNGSVHYRQKMGSLNLTARYEKPTLLVQAKMPMVLDLNDYKLYVNYFALMPYLVNQESQNNLAYLDFSKHQDLFNHIDIKKLVDYIEASTDIYYQLAGQSQIQTLSLTDQDRNAGAVEKIRLNSTLEELILQASLYRKVNQKYVVNHVLNMQEENTETDTKHADESETETTVKLDHDSINNAEVVSQALRHLVNQHIDQMRKKELEAVQAAQHTQQSDEVQMPKSVAEDAAPVTEIMPEPKEKQDHNALTKKQCEALKTNEQVIFGDLQYCHMVYGIDVLTKTKELTPDILTYFDRLRSLEKVFAQYDQNKFIDSSAFKALWVKHQAEIEKVLPPIEQRNPLVLDVALDQKGRAVRIDYDLNYTAKSQGKWNIKADMFISNYGHATSIDQAQLKQAKSWSEASKGSALEKMMGQVSKKLGQDEQLKQNGQTTPSLEHQLQDIAEQHYDKTHAYAPTYTSVFLAKLIESKPTIAQRYSTQDLQEIAGVYAYHYSNEKMYDPKAKELENIKTWAKKHHLEQDNQFNYRLGQDVDWIVRDAMMGSKDRAAWQKLQTQYSQPQQLFAKQYQIEFKQKRGLYADEKELLEQTAQVLGQVYVDVQNNQLSAQSIQSLTPKHKLLIDYIIFEDVYKKMRHRQ